MQTQTEKIEQSVETITDMLNEVEDDDFPVQTQLTNTHPPAQQKDKPSYFKHRFSIYRKISTPYLSTAPNQLNLFKSFSKCIKSIDSQAQILPIRTDRQIHSLSTTDQINQITEVDIPNYFTAYKKTKKTPSGDFHIGTNLPFEELKSHKNLTTWFHLHRYNVIISSCQSSDMIKIGFLPRVRCFTYRDDLKLGGLVSSLKNYIKNEELEKLFKTPDFSLKFNGQAAPVRKGHPTRIVQEVPEATTAYTENAFKKLYTSRPKRLATEFDHVSMAQQSEPTSLSLHTVSPINLPMADTSHPNLINRTSSSPQVVELEQGLKSTNDRLSRLENCCGMLAESTKNL
jgi:hypothetical protein